MSGWCGLGVFGGGSVGEMRVSHSKRNKSQRIVGSITQILPVSERKRKKLRNGKLYFLSNSENQD